MTGVVVVCSTHPSESTQDEPTLYSFRSQHHISHHCRMRPIVANYHQLHRPWQVQNLLTGTQQEIGGNKFKSLICQLDLIK